MKNFRTLAQAKKDMQVFQDYITLIETYQPQTFPQHVIHEYVHEGNIIRTAENLNRRGYDMDGRLIEPEDISSIIKSKPDSNDLLHQEIRRLYLKKIRSNISSSPSRFNW